MVNIIYERISPLIWDQYAKNMVITLERKIDGTVVIASTATVEHSFVESLKGVLLYFSTRDSFAPYSVDTSER